MKSYIVINNMSFYKKGTILVRHNDGLFAPSLNDYPKHCHFLTEEFILSKPLIFKNKQDYDTKRKSRRVST